MTRRRLFLLAGPLLSALFLWIALRNANLAQSWNTLRRFDPRLLAVPAAIVIVNFLLRTWRWQIIFPRGLRPRFWLAFRALTVSLAGNNLLPGRAGDFGRCVLVSRKISVSESTVAVGTLAVEKLLDGIALLAVVAYGLHVLVTERWLHQLAFVGFIVFALAFGFLLLLRLRSASISGLLHRAADRHRFPFAAKIAALVDSFSHGIAAVASPATLVVLFLQTAAIWATEGGLFYVFGLSLGIRLSASGALIASAILGLGLMIPAAPGAVGTYEFFGSSALRLIGVASAPALAITLLLHAWVLIFNTGIGLLAMATGGVSLSTFRTEKSRTPEPVRDRANSQA
jgi:uncharacterized protein (TIRG00374 family)